jgi:hypothetical protein
MFSSSIRPRRSYSRRRDWLLVVCFWLKNLKLCSVLSLEMSAQFLECFVIRPPSVAGSTM